MPLDVTEEVDVAVEELGIVMLLDVTEEVDVAVEELGIVMLLDVTEEVDVAVEEVVSFVELLSNAPLSSAAL